MDNLEEDLNKHVDDQANRYLEKYKPYVETLESNSIISRVRSVRSADVMALGKMLESWENVLRLCEADGSVSDLGILPKIALDVITVAYGTSPLALIATTQPIEEELGTVYYKKVTAKNTAGNRTAADKMVDVETGMGTISKGYAGAFVSAESVGTGDASTVTFTPTLANIPVRAGTVKITAGAIIATDVNQDGKLHGVGIADLSTINYTTGAVSIVYTTAPANALAITADYTASLEAMSDINAIGTELTTKSVRAHPYALKGTIGMLKSYALRKRFGTVAEDELALDLINMINSEIFGDAVRKMVTAQTGNTTWSKTVPSGISEYEHRMSFKYKLAATETVIVSNAGRGNRSFYVAGRNVCEYMSTQPGWVQLYDGNSISGGHLYGTLDGVPVIRIPSDTTVLDADKAVVGFKGLSNFEAPVAYAPYMPLTVTGMLPMTNPLNSQRAAASWVAVEVLVSEFLTGFEMT